jgi:hypothetical protein
MNTISSATIQAWLKRIDAARTALHDVRLETSPHLYMQIISAWSGLETVHEELLSHAISPVQVEKEAA